MTQTYRYKIKNINKQYGGNDIIYGGNDIIFRHGDKQY